jgi:hypothetical protein
VNSLFVTVNFCLVDEKISLVAEEIRNEKEKRTFGLFWFRSLLRMCRIYCSISLNCKKMDRKSMKNNLPNFNVWDLKRKKKTTKFL